MIRFDVITVMAVIALMGLAVISLALENKAHPLTCEEARETFRLLEMCRASPGCTLTLGEFGTYVELRKFTQDCDLGFVENEHE